MTIASSKTLNTLARGTLAVTVGMAALVAGGSPAMASPTNEHGFVDGPSCAQAEGFAKVIAETEGSRYVVCQKHGSNPPDLYYITANKAKPFPVRKDDVHFGERTFVILYESGHKVIVGPRFIKSEDPAGNVTGQAPAFDHKYRF